MHRRGWVRRCTGRGAPTTFAPWRQRPSREPAVTMPVRERLRAADETRTPGSVTTRRNSSACARASGERKSRSTACAGRAAGYGAGVRRARRRVRSPSPLHLALHTNSCHDPRPRGGGESAPAARPALRTDLRRHYAGLANVHPASQKALPGEGPTSAGLKCPRGHRLDTRDHNYGNVGRAPWRRRATLRPSRPLRQSSAAPARTHGEPSFCLIEPAQGISVPEATAAQCDSVEPGAREVIDHVGRDPCTAPWTGVPRPGPGP